MTRTGLRLSPARLVAWTAIILLTIYMVFLGGGWAGIHSVALRSASLFLIAAVLAVWGAAMIRRPEWRPRSRILPGFAVALAVFALGTALSRQPRLGLDYLSYSVLLTALYLLLVRLLADPWFRPRMLGMVVGLAVFIGAWYVQAVGAKWIEWWGLVGRITVPPLRPEFEFLTFGNPSAVLTMSVLLTIPAVAWIGVATRPRAIASGALILLCLVVSLLSGSRAGWLGMAVGVAVTGAAWLVPGENRAAVSRLICSRTIRLALAGAAIVAAITAVVFLPAVLARAGAGGETLRLSFVQSSLQMFSESPVHGTGPGTWVAQRITYTPPSATDYYIPHAHNVLAQTLAEFGLVGIAAGLFAAVLVGRLVWRAIRSGDTRRRLVGWGTVLGASYFAAHNLLDFYPSLPPALFAFAIPIAWLDATDEPDRAGSPGTTVIVALVGAVAIGLATVWLVWSESQAMTHDRAVMAMNAGQYEQALPDARQAAGSDPGIAAYHVTHGLAAADTGNPDEAADAFRRAASLDDLPDSWLGLAAAEFDLGDPDAARDALNRALRVGFQQPAIIIAAAGLDRRLGDDIAANGLLVNALVEAPSLGGDPGFLSLIDGPGDAVVNAALSQLAGSPAEIELALESGRIDVARAGVAGFDTDTRTVLELAVDAWTGDTTARSQLAAFTRQHPFDKLALGWSDRLARRSGDIQAAERFERWANLVEVFTGSSFRGLAIAKEEDPAGTVGSGAPFYGHYTYRRPTPWNLIPMDLIHLSWQ